MDTETTTTTGDSVAAGEATEARRVRAYSPSEAIRALLLIAPKDDVRYGLNSITLDTTGKAAILVATDGHRLLAVRVREIADDAPRGVYVIARELWAAVKPAKGAKQRRYTTGGRANGWEQTWQPLVLTIDGNNVAITGTTTTTGTLTDARFPEWRRVVPEKVSGERSQFDGHYLADFTEAARILGDAKSCATVAHNGDGAAHVNVGPDAFGVLMPMRCDAPPVISPDWIA